MYIPLVQEAQNFEKILVDLKLEKSEEIGACAAFFLSQHEGQSD